MKKEQEIRDKLREMLAFDTRGKKDLTFQKVACCKTLLWVLGENEDDRWWITAMSGPAIDSRAKDRN